MVLQARCFSLTSARDYIMRNCPSQRDYGAQSEREDGQYIGSTDGTRMPDGDGGCTRLRGAGIPAREIGTP